MMFFKRKKKLFLKAFIYFKSYRYNVYNNGNEAPIEIPQLFVIALLIFMQPAAPQKELHESFK